MSSGSGLYVLLGVVVLTAGFDFYFITSAGRDLPKHDTPNIFQNVIIETKTCLTVEFSQPCETSFPSHNFPLRSGCFIHPSHESPYCQFQNLQIALGLVSTVQLGGEFMDESALPFSQRKACIQMTKNWTTRKLRSFPIHNTDLSLLHTSVPFLSLGRCTKFQGSSEN